MLEGSVVYSKAHSNWIILIYNVYNLSTTSYWNNHRLWTAPCLSLCYVSFCSSIHVYITHAEWVRNVDMAHVTCWRYRRLIKGISGNDRCCSRRDPRFLSDVCFKEVRKAGLQPLLILIEVFIRHPDKSSTTMSGEEQREGQEVGMSFFCMYPMGLLHGKDSTNTFGWSLRLGDGLTFLKHRPVRGESDGTAVLLQAQSGGEKTFPKFAVFVPVSSTSFIRWSTYLNSRFIRYFSANGARRVANIGLRARPGLF